MSNDAKAQVIKAEATNGNIKLSERFKKDTLRRAVGDLFAAIKAFQFWGFLGWHDVKQRYRRSLLGPFWITLSTGVMVVALGVLYSSIFKQSVGNYMPYLATGLVAWNFIVTTVTDGCMVFMSAESAIKHIRIPLSAHVLRMVWRNLIVFAHNWIILIAMIAYFRIPIGLGTLCFPVGIAIIAVNCVWLSILLGMISARFRDVPQIVMNVMQMAFFVTPIIWKPEIIQNRKWVMDINPFYYLIELVRAPVLGQPISLHIWVTAVCITMLGGIFTIGIFSRFRARIAYWL